MNVSSPLPHNIVDLQNSVINFACIVFSVFSVVTYTSTLFRASSFGFHSVLYFQTVLVTMLWTITIFRNKLSIAFKVLTIAFIVFAVLISGLYAYGILAAGVFYISAIPVLVSFTLSYRKAVLTMFLLLLTYGVYGYLYVSGKLSYSFDLSNYATSPMAWVMNIAAILLTTWGLLYIVYSFSKTLTSNYNDIKEKNTQLKNYQENLKLLVKERTEELESALEELKASNEEIHEKNMIITDQNQELKSTLKHLKDTQTQLFQSEKMASLGILTAGVAHEINNPLNFIMGGYQGLKNYFNKYKPKNPEDTNLLLLSIKAGIDRATSIANSLSQFSSHSDTFNDQCIIADIIENCLIILRNKLVKRIEIVKKIDGHISSVRGNMGKLHQVFLNILTNAVQSISSKGTITITCGQSGQNLEVTISDTGCGISETDLPRVSDPFFTTKSPNEGTGLGLSVTYAIVSEHKGKIHFASQQNKGTTVTVILPTS